MNETSGKKVGRPAKGDRKDKVVSFRCRKGEEGLIRDGFQALMKRAVDEGDDAGGRILGKIVDGAPFPKYEPEENLVDKDMKQLRENNRRLFEDVGRLEKEVAELKDRLKSCSEMGIDEKGRRWMEAYFRLRDSRGGKSDGIDQTT